MEILHIFLFCISLVFWFILKPLVNSKSKKLPPGPNGLPIIGSLLKLGSKPNQSLAELAKIHGPLMSLKLGTNTTIVASTAESARDILHKYDETFSARTVPVAVASQPNHEGTIGWVPGDHQWKKKKRFLSAQMFTNQRLDSLQELRHQKVEQLVNHIKKQCAKGASVDIGRLVFATSLNLISSTIFSIDMVDSEFEKAHEFKELVWTIMEYAGVPNLSDYFPILSRFDLQGVKRRIEPAYLRLHEIFEEQIEKRLEGRKAGMLEKGDFLDVLLDQCQVQGSEFDRVNIKPLFVDLFIAGSDTSAITTEWAMAELLKQPSVLNKVREEIVEQVGAERAVKESDIEKLPYLQAAVREAMRLHPAVPLLLPHKAQNDIQVSGYLVPKNSQVLVNAWAIARDPNHWENPLEFKPERFLESSVDYKGRHFEYVPFGAGRRICSGWPLAVRMVNLMVASLVQPFTWKLPNGMAPHELSMEEQFGVSLRKAVPLVAIPTMD